MKAQTKERLDKVIVLRGLAASRARALSLIAGGKVCVNGQEVRERDHAIADSDVIAIIGGDIAWVSRAGTKLEHALNEWDIRVAGDVVLDIGASTGGFTDVLLTRGAVKVYALDVGHGQLAEKLRNDDRVVNMEGVHINDVTKDDFPKKFPLIVIDVSFISLTKVLAKAKELLAPKGGIVALIKPQFEVGKNDIKKGVVRDRTLHERVLKEITLFAKDLGLEVVEPISSPILGGDGNREFLVYMKK